jgi:hypothetical protein
MTQQFLTEVRSIIEPILDELGFRIDEYVGDIDEGGRTAAVVFYRSDDCKMQIYYSAREGEINFMIAPLDVPNEFGLNGEKWYYISYFSKRPDLLPKERLRQAIAEVQTYDNRLDWVKDRIIKHYETARAGILEKFGSGS